MAGLDEVVQKFMELADESADATFPGKISDTVKLHSVLGAIFLVFPIFLDGFAYAIVLWHLYYKLSNLAGVPFFKNFFKSVLSGYIVNVIIIFICNIILDLFIGLGSIVLFAVGYFSIYFSGVAYIEVLTKMYKSGEVKAKINYDNMLNPDAKNNNPEQIDKQ